MTQSEPLSPGLSVGHWLQGQFHVLQLWQALDLVTPSHRQEGGMGPSGMRGLPSSCHHHLPDPLLQVSRVSQSHQTPIRGEDVWSPRQSSLLEVVHLCWDKQCHQSRAVGLLGPRGMAAPVAQNRASHLIISPVSHKEQLPAGLPYFPSPALGPAAPRWHQAGTGMAPAWHWDCPRLALGWHQDGPRLALGWPPGLQQQERMAQLCTQHGLARPRWELPSGQEMAAWVWALEMD